MSAPYVVIGVSMFVLVLTAVLALVWAARSGQFSDMRGGARVIFDEDEPVGVPTDMVFKRRARKVKTDKTAQSEEIS